MNNDYRYCLDSLIKETHVIKDISTTIRDFIGHYGVNKILDHMDENEIQNYLRIKKIDKINIKLNKNR